MVVPVAVEVRVMLSVGSQSSPPSVGVVAVVVAVVAAVLELDNVKN